MAQPEPEHSPSGNPIYRPGDPNPFAPPGGADHLEEITDHVQRWIGGVEAVFHELVSDTVHLDVLHVPPSDVRPCHVLVTCGMSDLPMQVPPDADVPRHLELMTTLPPDWQVSDAAFRNQRWYWPVGLMKFMARYPHKYNTWLGWGHSMPNGDPPQPLGPGTRLCGAVLLPTVSFAEEFHELGIPGGPVIQFLSLIPVYREEMELKLREGVDSLMDRFDEHGINDLIQPDRPNAPARARQFGRF